MTPERWRKIEEVFQTVVEQPQDQRQLMLTQYCEGDTELRREVEALLAENETDDFLRAPISDVAKSLPASPEDGFIGQKIGSYHVVKLLGQGGMGAVYLAERADEEYYRQVALKIVRQGMDSRFVLKRFRVERQILAMLEHPNIAQMLDGGTTSNGLPYFVMEYVAGEPITEYCAANKLSVSERLRLFLPVCNAVQHAHQKLIVHRDLKPSNILVTADGVPKLLDFGIAKLLDPSLSPLAVTRTMTLLRMMTPDYASPEQVRGLPITAASDVYSLGVVLYELLTGTRPYQFETYSAVEIERVVCDTAVENPSSRVQRITNAPLKFHKQIAGDLDNIVLMALRKEPERRYQSVEQLAEDIRCYLAGRPISARSESAIYRTSKFVRRNKLAVAAAALVFFSLLGGILATSRAAQIARAERSRAEANLSEAQAQRAEAENQRAEADRQRIEAEKQRAEAMAQRGRAEAEAAEANHQRSLAEAERLIAEAQRERADRRFAQVRKLANTFLFDFHDKIATLPGSTEARELVVKTALEYLDSLAKEAEGDTSLQSELAIAYLRVGEVQGDPQQSNLRNYNSALGSYQNSIKLAESLLAKGYTDAALRNALASAYVKTGHVRYITGKKEPTKEPLQKALEITRQLLAENSRDEAAFDTMASANQVLAIIEMQSGNELETLEFNRRMVAICETWAKELGTTKARSKLAFSYQNLGIALTQSGALDEAGDIFRRALAIQQELCLSAPNDVNQQNRLASMHCSLGATLLDKGEARAAANSYQQCIQMLEDQIARDPKDGRALLSLQYNYLKYGSALVEADPAQAVIAIRKVLDRGSNAYSPSTINRIYHLQNLARSLWALGDRPGAEQNLLEVRRLLQNAPAGRLNAPGLGDTLLRQVGLLLLEMGNQAGALEYLRQSLQSVRDQMASNSKMSDWLRELSVCLDALGKYHATLAVRPDIPAKQRNDHWREARDWYRQSLTALQQRVKKWPGDTQSTQRIAAVSKQIVECDSVLSKLTAGSQP
ncbi:MAG: protein kinase [Blastocatellales bacterium]